ncbi:hypothetical protein BOTBODRAFT_109497 [Botryobasidium botryosum FD-172 SS1]|uniref:Cytochrome b5 heme-binding domain-containing protein n=1 Tax=Botryobasidium botryosum (strain FD-172 SS1) TaxID=930990 RepID=A0A067MGM2_BOTB1|nr:hypothetical protein BOTBODRAFT_109497 [Botryobasidium botryosum FD-172 SS1]
MASYIRSFFRSPSPVPRAVTPVDADVSFSISEPSPPASDSEGTVGGKDRDEDDDAPPAFPSLNSIQRSDHPAALSSDSARMPPPAFGRGSPSSPQSPSFTLTPPPTTTKPMPKVNRKAKARDKVALTPGHSPLDWARLKSSGASLRNGFTSLQRVTPSELKKHNTPEDAWSSFNGKVYNITPYLSFHPGGQKELMRCAGRDGSKLFALTHSWVNLDYMLDGCMIGFMVPEPSQ